MICYICMDKYQDWLEADSVFTNYPTIEKVKIIYKEGPRNSQKAVEGLFERYKSSILFEYISLHNTEEWFHYVELVVSNLNENDIIAAPFVRYRDVWKLVPVIRRKRAISIHLSESFPDSFGKIGYRFGFRWRDGRPVKGFFKQLLIAPFAYIYALLHKPDVCFYNMWPMVKNPFVKKTEKAVIPQISQKKKEDIIALTNGEKRTLLLGGSGYDYKRMALSLNLTRYISTSKHKEIIIDGIIHPLDDFICAEEVLLSGVTNKIIGYNSTAICWAYRIGDIDIETYESTDLNRVHGLYGYFSRKTLKKCGIKLLQERNDFIIIDKNDNATDNRRNRL